MIPQVLGTKASEADRWATLPERGTPTSLRVIAWIAAHIGRWGARLLLYPITLYFVITARSARRTSYEYLKRLRGESARWWHVFRHVHCFAVTIAHRVYLLRGDFVVFGITVHDQVIVHLQIYSRNDGLLRVAHVA